ncbi:hypothetical protein CHS0354_020751 [Potamilus streckersoni]|uniref:Uncharacterized protein n=1 Tax=Potamilus streckersoni TaxID=2493646 RepID=A0AAE0SCN8_9BIVA|nr:hypothetical protein CHS0354_020751 [Potamilus streckersoni]
MLEEAEKMTNEQKNNSSTRLDDISAELIKAGARSAPQRITYAVKYRRRAYGSKNVQSMLQNKCSLKVCANCRLCPTCYGKNLDERTLEQGARWIQERQKYFPTYTDSEAGSRNNTGKEPNAIKCMVPQQNKYKIYTGNQR